MHIGLMQSVRRNDFGLVNMQVMAHPIEMLCGKKAFHSFYKEYSYQFPLPFMPLHEMQKSEIIFIIIIY